MEDKIYAELRSWLDEKSVKIDYGISFPIYRVLPDEVQLALNILNKHGMKISVSLKPKDETQEKK